jgi:Zn-dependent protease with chaperone function
VAFTNDEFDALVARLQADAKADPAGYRRRVLLLTLAGFAYLFVLLAVVAGGLGAIAYAFAHARGSGAALVKLAIPLVYFGWVILRCLWVPFSPPPGRGVAREKAPALYALADELRRRMKAPAVHAVVINEELNAAVSQVPRLGPLGWYKNYLVLGVPLMASMPPAEFVTVLAHEFGHLSREHGRFTAWIHRARMTWARLDAQLREDPPWGSWVLSVFVRRYAPYFNAYTFVLSRLQEYEADRLAAEQADAATAAAALARLELLSRALDESFFPSIRAQCAKQPAPPRDACTRMIAELRAAPVSPQAKRWLEDAAGVRTSNADTHPAFADRVRALGCARIGAPPVVAESAAQRYLGRHAAEAEADANELWAQAASEGWAAQHEELAGLSARAGALRAKQAAGPLAVEELWELAECVATVEGARAGLAHAQAVLARAPDHAGAHMMAGQALLSANDAAGVAYLERAAALDGALRGPALSFLERHWQQMRRYDEAEKVHRRLNAHGDELEKADEERQGLSAQDRVLAHGVPEAELARLRSALASHEGVKTAWLVRKSVSHLPEVPFFVLGIEADVAWYKLRSADGDQELLQKLAQGVPMPGQGILLILSDAAIKRSVEAAGGPVYVKP